MSGAVCIASRTIFTKAAPETLTCGQCYFCETVFGDYPDHERCRLGPAGPTVNASEDWCGKFLGRAASENKETVDKTEQIKTGGVIA